MTELICQQTGKETSVKVLRVHIFEHMVRDMDKLNIENFMKLETDNTVLNSKYDTSAFICLECGYTAYFGGVMQLHFQKLPELTEEDE